MAPTRPRRGAVVGRASPSRPGGDLLAAGQRASSRDGRWRGDAGFEREDGIKITLRREPGVTEGNVLRVPFRFQTPPLGDLARPYGFDWSTYNAVRLGEMSRPQGRTLREIPIDTMFLDGPAVDSSSGVVVWDGVADPQGMLEELAWIAGALPGSEPQVFRLVLSQPAVWGPRALVNMLAVMTSITPTQKPDSIGTEYTSIVFKEWRDNSEVDRKQRPRKTAERTHRLDLADPDRDDEGDSLYKLATRYYHRPSAWPTIAKANGIKGVSPGSEADLATWAKRHHKKTLKIPARAIS